MALKLDREKLSKAVFAEKGRQGEDGESDDRNSDDTSTEIKSGIKDGDEVISGSYSAISRKLKDGSEGDIDKEQGSRMHSAASFAGFR